METFYELYLKENINKKNYEREDKREYTIFYDENAVFLIKTRSRTVWDGSSFWKEHKASGGYKLRNC